MYSSFGQAERDHLDPDMHGVNDVPDSTQEIKGAIKEWDTKHWDYKPIDCCLSGKDGAADGGQIGIEIISVDLISFEALHTESFILT